MKAAEDIGIQFSRKTLSCKQYELSIFILLQQVADRRFRQDNELLYAGQKQRSRTTRAMWLRLTNYQRGKFRDSVDLICNVRRSADPGPRSTAANVTRGCVKLI